MSEIIEINSSWWDNLINVKYGVPMPDEAINKYSEEGFVAGPAKLPDLLDGTEPKPAELEDEVFVEKVPALSAGQIEFKRSEIEKPRDRIVVYGTRLSGAFELAGDFADLLEEKGLTPNIMCVRYVDRIEVAFFYEGPDKLDEVSLPRGVIMFPEMRFDCGPNSGRMDVNTPYERIERLCSKYGVKSVRLASNVNNEEYSLEITNMLTQAEEEGEK